MQPFASTRDRLRTETRDCHEALDADFAAFGLGSVEGLAVFLATQHAAMASLVCRPGPDRAEADALSAEMQHALAADLATLGAPAPVAPPEMTADATAVLYILLGSRLGTQVMARHWRATARGPAREAGRYLTLDPRREAWRAFVAREGATDGATALGDAQVADARRIFDHFAAALRLNRMPAVPEVAHA